MVPDALTLAGALYKTLRTMKSMRFNPDNYFWKIGQLTFAEMAQDRVTHFREAPEEATLLYGIRVEIDYNNDFGLRLFEDITDTIGLPPKEKKVRCIDCRHVSASRVGRPDECAICDSPIWDKLGYPAPHMIYNDVFKPILCDYFEEKEHNPTVKEGKG